MFQTNPPLCDLRMGDVRDALDTSSHILCDSDKRAYCMSIGINYDNAIMYYELVQALERMASTSPSPRRQFLMPFLMPKPVRPPRTDEQTL